MTKEIQAGSVVVLKSGGPVMTVTSVDDGSAHVVWYEQGKQVQRASIEVSALKPYEEEKDDILPYDEF